MPHPAQPSPHNDIEWRKLHEGIRNVCVTDSSFASECPLIAEQVLPITKDNFMEAGNHSNNDNDVNIKTEEIIEECWRDAEDITTFESEHEAAINFIKQLSGLTVGEMELGHGSDSETKMDHVDRIPGLHIEAKGLDIHPEQQAGNLGLIPITLGRIQLLRLIKEGDYRQKWSCQRRSTAQAQKHANQRITPQAVSDITEGEKRVTGEDSPIAGGPAAVAQSIETSASQLGQNNSIGTLDSATISHVTSAEKGIAGQNEPAKGGPTVMAQKHAGEPINGQTSMILPKARRRSPVMSASRMNRR
ncbi:hypothetical protein F5Y09DRAFT_341666 [Xylaria sp. FL1042]|nr:hypothetical protein F5Y09DRAFT_341666 [Xylaria sp. FL1042]